MDCYAVLVAADFALQGPEIASVREPLVLGYRGYLTVLGVSIRKLAIHRETVAVVEERTIANNQFGEFTDIGTWRTSITRVAFRDGETCTGRSDQS